MNASIPDHPPHVLVADDQKDVRTALDLLLRGRRFRVTAVGSPAEALHALEEREFDVLLLDLNYARDTTSGREGLDLLGRIRALDETLPVVVMTAWGSVEGAVEAMKRGARDYIEKPWNNERLLATLAGQVELGRAVRRARRLEAENRLLREGDAPFWIAASKAMEPVLRLIERVGPSEANVLITGEPGTGKEIAARKVHAASSRASRPLVTVNAGGLAGGVLESELFGHVKGAFTGAVSERMGYFEVADGGTLFLDEIGSMALEQQTRLLRVLETGEVQRVGSSRTLSVDVRVISATNSDLAEAVARGAFREDLFYRLNAVEIRLPPLCRRREDLPLLAGHYLAESGRRYGGKELRLDPEAMAALLDHPWPGNVRELRHRMERAALLADGPRVGAEHLGLGAGAGDPPGPEPLTLEASERALILRALGRHDGNVSRAAETLGISRSALYRRLERYGIRA